ncbi:hypothetical protein ACM9ES_000819 [Vibrio alginolyticus]
MADRLNDYIERLDVRLKTKYKRNRLHFTVSEELCVYYEQRDFTLNFLTNIGYAVFTLGVPIHLDLKACPLISASALVMLFAEVSRARLAKDRDDIVTIDLPDIPDTPWLHAMSLPYRQYASLFDEDQVFQTVSDPNKAMASILKLLHKSGVQLSNADTRLFTRGVNEAMLNVINHAYIDEDDPLGGIGRRWWQACWVHTIEEQKTLVYIIYDLGCGILKSLPPTCPEEDAEAHIARAMSYGVTRTNESDRGKGTKNMEDATLIRANSLLFIGTNKVSYIKAEGLEARTESNLLPFTGTLVEWQIKL